MFLLAPSFPAARTSSPGSPTEVPLLSRSAWNPRVQVVAFVARQLASFRFRYSVEEFVLWAWLCAIDKYSRWRCRSRSNGSARTLSGRAGTLLWEVGQIFVFSLDRGAATSVTSDWFNFPTKTLVSSQICSGRSLRKYTFISTRECV